MTAILAALALAAAQPASDTPPPIRMMTQREVTEANIGLTINAVYDVISGPVGQQRDFARMRSLFTPDARMYSLSLKGLQGGPLSVYIKNNGPVLAAIGFTERELVRRVEVYGGIAHVWSSYEGTSADAKIRVRGINSFQLARQSDGRWLVHSLIWQPEGGAEPLPQDMERR